MGVSQNGASATERTVVPDLDESTWEGRASRTGFDRVVAVGGVLVHGRTAEVPVPRTSDLRGSSTGWVSLDQRIDRDGSIVDAAYEEAERADERVVGVDGALASWQAP